MCLCAKQLPERVSPETFTGNVAGWTSTMELQDFPSSEPDGLAHGRLAVVGATGKPCRPAEDGAFQAAEGRGSYEGQIVFTS